MAELIKVFGKQPEEYRGIRYWNSNLIRFEGKEFLVSHNAVLTLITISSCNASCKFCSNEITFTPNGKYLKFDDYLKRIVSFAKLGGINKVAFSGGEPTANPQALYDLFVSIVPYFPKSRIHTNGFGLLKKVKTVQGEEKILLDALIECGLTGVSLSIGHFDDEINRNMMRFRGSWKGLSPIEIGEISSRNSTKFQVRMSCVLTLAGIKNVEDIRKYIEWGHKFNIKYFIFRSPSWIPSEFAKETSVTRFNRLNHVDIDPITAKLDTFSQFERVFAEHKTDSHVHVYKYKKEITVDIDASSEEPDPDNKIRRLIVMPNTVAYKSWIDPHSNLFEDQTELAKFYARQELPELGRVEIE